MEEWLKVRLNSHDLILITLPMEVVTEESSNQ